MAGAGETQTLRQWTRHHLGATGRGYSIDCVQTTGSTGAGKSHAGTTKRVHYAAQTFARASSLSGHIPGYDHGPANTGSGGGGGNGGGTELAVPRSSRHSMLQRQLSTTTGPPPPLPPPSGRPPSGSILKNGTGQSECGCVCGCQEYSKQLVHANIHRQSNVGGTLAVVALVVVVVVEVCSRAINNIMLVCFTQQCEFTFCRGHHECTTTRGWIILRQCYCLSMSWRVSESESERARDNVFPSCVHLQFN